MLMIRRLRSYQQPEMVSLVLDLAVAQAIDLLSRFFNVGTSTNGTPLSVPMSGGPHTHSQPSDKQLALRRGRTLVAHDK